MTKETSKTIELLRAEMADTENAIGKQIEEIQWRQDELKDLEDSLYEIESDIAVLQDQLDAEETTEV